MLQLGLGEYAPSAHPPYQVLAVGSSGLQRADYYCWLNLEAMSGYCALPEFVAQRRIEPAEAWIPWVTRSGGSSRCFKAIRWFFVLVYSSKADRKRFICSACLGRKLYSSLARLVPRVSLSLTPYWPLERTVAHLRMLLEL